MAYYSGLARGRQARQTREDNQEARMYNRSRLERSDKINAQRNAASDARRLKLDEETSRRNAASDTHNATIRQRNADLHDRKIAQQEEAKRYKAAQYDISLIDPKLRKQIYETATGKAQGIEGVENHGFYSDGRFGTTAGGNTTIYSKEHLLVMHELETKLGTQRRKLTREDASLKEKRKHEAKKAKLIADAKLQAARVKAHAVKVKAHAVKVKAHAELNKIRVISQKEPLAPLPPLQALAAAPVPGKAKINPDKNKAAFDRAQNIIKNPGNYSKEDVEFAKNIISSHKSQPEVKPARKLSRSTKFDKNGKPIVKLTDGQKAANKAKKEELAADQLLKTELEHEAEERYVEIPKALDEPKKKAVKSKHGKRADGTEKGDGFKGRIKNDNGTYSTEMSIGVNINGKETEIPLIVSNSTPAELKILQSGGKPTKAMIDKAVKHARPRMSKGLSPFAQKGEVKKPKTLPKRRPTKIELRNAEWDKYEKKMKDKENKEKDIARRKPKIQSKTEAKKAGLKIAYENAKKKLKEAKKTDPKYVDLQKDVMWAKQALNKA